MPTTTTWPLEPLGRRLGVLVCRGPEHAQHPRGASQPVQLVVIEDHVGGGGDGDQPHDTHDGDTDRRADEPVLTPMATRMNENSLICATVTLVRNEVRSL
jgi:hypothetical protein